MLSSFLFIPSFLFSLPLIAVSQSVSYVENTGICETTPGVSDYSGYINLDSKSNDAFWFWFFEARSDPDNKPLTLWLNGGPGCSSMIGLFQEHGPCTVNSDEKTTSFNPYSWNNHSNMLYIDQPFGAGFSTGRDVNTTQSAAEYMWQGLQVWFANETFSKYQDREFILATESFGGRFGPVFTQYFHSQNAKIDSGDESGHKIVVSKLLINNGKHDPIIQMNSSIAFARDAPGYGSLITNITLLDDIQTAYNEECAPALERCANGRNNTRCRDAIVLCTHEVGVPSFANRDPNDLRQTSTSSSDNEEQNDDDYSEQFPPTYYTRFIRRNGIKKAIGARGMSFDQCDSSVKARFSGAGETGRSFLSNLAELADAKEVDILIWAGDSDLKSNWIGVHDCVAQMSWWGNETFASMPFTNLTLDGAEVGTYKVVPDGVTFVRVFNAGHTMPAYQPKTAQTIFARFISGSAIEGSPEEEAGDVNGGGSDDSGNADGALILPLSMWWSMAIVPLCVVAFA